jgi:hypothetical protein
VEHLAGRGTAATRGAHARVMSRWRAFCPGQPHVTLFNCEFFNILISNFKIRK